MSGDTDTLASEMTNPIYFDPSEAENAGEPSVTLDLPEKVGFN